jgi:hypothetical protein
MAETFRKSKIEKFIKRAVQYMEMQQRIIENAKKQGLPEDSIRLLEITNTATYNYTCSLCEEFQFEMPHVLGVTPT